MRSALRLAGVLLCIATAAGAQGSLRRSTDVRAIVRGVVELGRLERPEMMKQILPLTTHARPEVRAAALDALGQALAAVPRGDGQTGPLPPEVATVTKALLTRLRAEPDASVAGIAAETLGRLPFRTVEAVKEAEEALAALLPSAEGASRLRPGEPLARVVYPESMSGAVKGLETRSRIYRKLAPVAAETIARLRSAATFGSDPSDGDLAFIRRVAWQALNNAGGADVSLVERGLDDPDAQVRRLAVLTLANVDDAGPAPQRLLARALGDSSFIVRYDAVRTYSRTHQAADCAPVLAAVDDRHAHVALAAIDALGSGCPAGPSPTAKLAALSDALPAGGADWHRAAHAFVSLARVAREESAPRLPRFAEHPVWHVRMYAARAATAIMAAARLERMADDPHDNVREAAIAGLVTLRRHDADAVYIAALSRRDYQLVLTAADALAQSPHADRAVPALLAAFARITAERRDTSRDPRVAILRRLAELGSKQHAHALQSCLSDFDPEVARQCAATLQAWTGTAHVARPAPKRPAAPAAIPLARRARLTMERGGTFELHLFPDDAPATVARFVRLARQGYYNGLTFHRVVPNFVLQGGSPGANEYMGDGPYMSDELASRTHARGTLGISTRGRHTGDAQIFINLVDNPRLDHNYTVFAEVTAGMDVVDGILEGDVIARVDVLEPASTQSRR